MDRIPKFPGFGHYKVPGQFFKYPVILEDYWSSMTGAEHKVLTFILRKTYGWQKLGDRIALSQFTGDGYDEEGIGISRSQVRRSLASLEDKGFIKLTRYARRPSYIELVLNDDTLRKLEQGVFDNKRQTLGYQSVENAHFMDNVNFMKDN